MGVQTMLDGGAGTGRKGAIAVPGRFYVRFQEVLWVYGDADLPLSRNWLYFSIMG